MISDFVSNYQLKQKKKFSLNIFPSFERKRIAGRKKVNALKDGSLILKKLIELYFI